MFLNIWLLFQQSIFPTSIASPEYRRNIPLGWPDGLMMVIYLFFLKLKLWPLLKVGKTYKSFIFSDVFQLLPLVVDQDWIERHAKLKFDRIADIL